MRFTLTLALALCCLTGTTTAQDFPLPDQPHIVVVGEGEIERIPDIVEISVQVSQTANSFAEAKQLVDHTIGRIIIAGRDNGVPSDEINASKINAVPQFDWKDGERIYKGEQVNRTVSIKLRDAVRYNALVDALLAAGITRLNSVQLEFSDKKALEADAMELALEDAAEQAKTIAKHLRSRIQKPFQIAPLTSHPIMHRLEMTAAMSDSAKPEPKGELKLGKQSIKQQVRVVYLLD